MPIVVVALAFALSKRVDLVPDDFGRGVRIIGQGKCMDVAGIGPGQTPGVAR